MSEPTAARVLDEGRRLIMTRGYNGFSYADVAAAVGIRKASIHHHFPAKGDLAVAVVEQARTAIRAQAALLDTATPDARTQLLGYTRYWAHCIADQSAPFCVAAMLAAELPSLPAPVAAAVRGHFADLTGWLARTLALGAAQGSVILAGTPEAEADAFMASVYGAMLAARAFDDPARFGAIIERLLSRMVAFS